MILCPVVASSHVSSLRLDDDTQEQLARSAKQARTTKKAVVTLRCSRRGIEWNSSSEDGWYASERQEETVEEERR